MDIEILGNITTSTKVMDADQVADHVSTYVSSYTEGRFIDKTTGDQVISGHMTFVDGIEVGHYNYDVGNECVAIGN